MLGGLENPVERELLFFFAGAALSGLFSWLATAIYYRKSLDQQEAASEKQIQRLLKAIQDPKPKPAPPQAPRNGFLGFIVKETAPLERELIRQKRIEECLAEYKRAGTPVRVIDTYQDMTNEEKAELLDTVLLRARGRPAKNNKYCGNA